MLSLFKVAISEIFAIFKRKSDLAAAESENKARLLRDKDSHNSSWEMAALAADKLWFLRNASFCLYTIPIIYSVIDPEEASIMWESLDTVPDWIIGVQLTMTGFIWAAKPMASVGAAIVSKSKVVK